MLYADEQSSMRKSGGSYNQLPPVRKHYDEWGLGGRRCLPAETELL